MATIHISEAEAAADFASLMAHLRAGETVLVGAPGEESVLVSGTPIRLLSDALKRVREHASDVTLDDQFGRDLEAIIAENREPGPSRWD